MFQINLGLEKHGFDRTERVTCTEWPSGQLLSCPSSHSGLCCKDWYSASAREDRVEVIQDRPDGRIRYTIRELDPLLVSDLRIEDPRIGTVPVNLIIPVLVPKPEPVA